MGRLRRLIWQLPGLPQLTREILAQTVSFSTTIVRSMKLST
jgi:hypothetical protein